MDDCGHCPRCGGELKISPNPKLLYECSDYECDYREYLWPNTPKGGKTKGGLKMDSTEKWNKVVDFYQKDRKSLETVIQKDWETISSEILGYKVIDGNIEAQKHVAYATGNPIKIDILLRKDNKDICIVELKQHQPLDKKWQEQLFTYLKQMKVKIGILVCDNIYLYSYDFAKDDSDQSCVIVDFERNNPDGIKFIDMFTKNNFNEEAISTFITEQGGKKKNVKEIQAQINEILLYDLLKKHFVPKYPVEDFNAAIQNMNIYISAEIPVTIPDVPFMPKDKDENDLDKSEIYTICRKNGINLPHNHNDFTKAKLNNGVPKYWANPNKKLLSQEWWLTLVDINKRELHVFRIPANSIRAEQLKFKSPNLIDLQIYYNDHHYPNFTDSRSGIHFKKWLVRTIPY